MENQFKGTPGSWRFDSVNKKIKGRGPSLGQTVVADVSPEMPGTPSKEEMKANSELIASAPELLSLAQNFVANYKAGQVPGYRTMKEFEKIILRINGEEE